MEDYEEQMVGDPPGEENNQGVSAVKIGSIDIGTFGGNLEDWEAFRDLFEQLVHNSKRMSMLKVAKLKKSVLKKN